MAEDRINYSNFSNIRAITPSLTKLYVHNLTWPYILSISHAHEVLSFSLSLSLSISLSLMLN